MPKKNQLVSATWKEFEAVYKARPIQFMGSTSKELKALTKIIDAQSSKIKPANDRTYNRGTTNIAFKKPDGGVSHLEKKGKVYIYGNHFLIVTVSKSETYGDKQTVVIYRDNGEMSKSEQAAKKDDGSHIHDESMLTKGQNARLNKNQARLDANNAELNKWKEVKKQEEAQDMTKVAIYTDAVVEALESRGAYILSKRAKIITAINNEHKGEGSSTASADMVSSLAGSPDDCEKEDEEQSSTHIDQTGSYVKFKPKKRKLVTSNGDKINLGAGEKIHLDDNTFDEVMDFITKMNAKFPELGLRPDDIYFEEGDSMDTLNRLNEHFGSNVDNETKEDEEENSEENNSDDSAQSDDADDISADEEDDNEGSQEDDEPDDEDSEEEEEETPAKVRIAKFVLSDEQQDFINDITVESLSTDVESEDFKELFPEKYYQVDTNPEGDAHLSIEKYIDEAYEESSEPKNEKPLSLDDALKDDE